MNELKIQQSGFKKNQDAISTIANFIKKLGCETHQFINLL